jgi:uncharacterized membrane protein YfcA
VASERSERGLGARNIAPARPDALPPAADAEGLLRRSRGRLAEIGIVGGVLSGLLGVGGGIVMVPLLVLRARYGQREAHAVSLAAIIPISAAGAGTYGLAGEIRFGAAAALAIGAIAGAQLGAAVLSRASERGLKASFGAFLLVVAALMAIGR